MELPGQVSESSNQSVAQQLSGQAEDDTQSQELGTKCPVCGVRAVFVSRHNIPMCGPVNAEDELFHKHDGGYYFHNDEQEGIDVTDDETNKDDASGPTNITYKYKA